MTGQQLHADANHDCLQGDRRRTVRFHDAQGDTVLVWIEGQPPQTAVLIDESPLGIGIALRDHAPLEIGQSIEVVFRGTVQAGVVASLKSYSDVLRVGLEWGHAREPSS